MTTGFVWHERYMWHDTGSQVNYLPAGGMTALQPLIHVENPETKRRLKNLLDVLGVTEQLTPIKPQMATEAELTRFHTATYVAQIKEMSDNGGGDAGILSPFAAGGYEIACLAVGGAIALVEAVVTGDVDNGYALVRPPGHHAIADKGMGFCIFGHTALSAMHARQALGVAKVAIVDWDVHHGNGTQAAFYDDPTVLTISLHQTNCFPPRSGSTDDNGEGAGVGTNINVNMPPGCGHAAYLYALENVVVPALKRFEPDLILVASGYDAGGMDPLSRTLAYGSTFGIMMRQVKAVADELCGGKVAVMHEGGYSAAHVPFCGLAVIEELAGIDSGVVDPFERDLASMGGDQLLPHHIESIDEATALIEKIPA